MSATLLVVYCVGTWGRGAAVASVVPNADATPNPLDISSGAVAGLSAARIMGRNAVLGAVVPEDVWDAGGDLPPLPPTPAPLSVSSSSPLDGAGGPGATTIMLRGVGWLAGAAPGGPLLPIAESLLLAGTTPVATRNLFLGVNSAEVAAAGAQGMNVGTLQGSTSGAAPLLAFRVPPTLSSSLAARYVVPDGFAAFVTGWRAGLNQPSDARSVIFTLWSSSLDDGAKTIVHWTAVQAGGTSAADIAFSSAPIRIPPRSVLTVTASASAPGSDVYCTVDMLLRAL